MAQLSCDRETTARVIQDVIVERDMQEKKHGQCSLIFQPPASSLAILIEEVGEVARAILEGNRENFREELVQVAGVAVAMVEALDMEDASTT